MQRQLSSAGARRRPPTAHIQEEEKAKKAKKAEESLRMLEVPITHTRSFSRANARLGAQAKRHEGARLQAAHLR